MSEIETITCEELAKKLGNRDKFVLLDVREEDEWEESHIDGAKLLPLSEFEELILGFDKSEEYVLHCKRGGRSLKACQIMKDLGFPNVNNLEGGMDEWEEMP